MNPSISPTPSASIGNTMRYSCITCGQRKVKCDRNHPCSNCVKAGCECIPSNPAPPRRRKRKTDLDLRERLKRCEELLKKFGATVDDEDAGNQGQGYEKENNVRTKPQKDIASPEPAGGTLIAKPGMTRFINNNLWSGLLDELRDTADILESTTSREDDSDGTNNSLGDGSGLIFSSSLRPLRLSHLHPPPVQMFRLWQVFMDNVNPVTKIVHTPTLQSQILDASSNIEKLPRNFEPLLFSIYLCAVVSLSDEECMSMVGENRETLINRYASGTEQALVRMGFLQSSDLVALQALALFLIAMRTRHNPHAFWILCGVAIRMAQRMGVHRDGALLDQKLSPFQTEMRRRLWWLLAILDSRSAVPAGMGWSMLGRSWDTKIPGNYNDGDLYPDMRDLPIEHTGQTEMIFCLTAFEVVKCFHDAGTTIDWKNKTSVVADTDKWLDDLEIRLRDKYLRYCDPSIPLHILSEGVSRTIIANKRLFAHHPRKNNPDGLRQEAKMDMLFENSLTIMGYDCLLHSSKNMKGFWWHVKGNFQYDIFVFLLSELRHRTLGPQSDRAWQVVQELYSHHPELLVDKSHELRMAVGNLVLEVWEGRELALRRVNQFMGLPAFILAIRSQRSKLRQADANSENTENPSGNLPLDGRPNIEFDHSTTMFSGGATGYDIGMQFNNTMSLEMHPVDWEYWNDLLREYDIQPGGVGNGQFFG